MKLQGIPVVLDTNFLLLPFQRRIDLFGEIERLLEEPHYFVIVKQTLDELREMAKRMKRNSPAARAALAMVEKMNFQVAGNYAGNADSAIVSFCVANLSAILCTNDRQLRARVKKLKVKLCLSRDKGHLALA